MTSGKQDTTTPVFIVSSYVNSNGILRFVNEQVQSYIRQGYKVTSVSLTPSTNSDVSYDLQTCRGALRWLLFCLRPKKALTILHYYNSIVFPKHRNLGLFNARVLKLLQILALASVGRTSSDSRVYFHEIETGSGIIWWWRTVLNFCLCSFKLLNFYNNAFRETVTDTFVGLRSKPFAIEDHSQHMTRLFLGSQSEARTLLKIPEKAVVFLCLGFISYWKGIDIAVKAFGQADLKNAQLHIVGSPGDLKEPVEFCAALHKLASNYENVRITEDFVEDVMFDCWLQAADVLILPYRSISSSGVGARGLVYGKQLVISDLPSLKESLPEATVFRDEKHLAEILLDLSNRLSGQQDSPLVKP